MDPEANPPLLYQVIPSSRTHHNVVHRQEIALKRQEFRCFTDSSARGLLRGKISDNHQSDRQQSKHTPVEGGHGDSVTVVTTFALAKTISSTSPPRFISNVRRRTAWRLLMSMRKRASDKAQ